VVGPEYVTLAQLKSWVNIPQDDTQFDADLTVALSGAHDWARRRTGGRRFDLAAVATARTFRPAGRQFCTDDGYYGFQVDDIGDVTGLVVETGNTTWSTVTSYTTYPDNALVLGQPVTALIQQVPWPCYGSDLIRVTARWGWPAQPDDLGLGIRIQASRLYGRRRSPEGVLGSSEWGTVRVGRIDPDADELIGNLAYPGFA
jgi:hypothetical protein